MLKPNKLLKTLISMLAGFTMTLSLFLSTGSASALGAMSSVIPLYFLRSGDCTGDMVETLIVFRRSINYGYACHSHPVFLLCRVFGSSALAQGVIYW